MQYMIHIFSNTWIVKLILFGFGHLFFEPIYTHYQENNSYIPDRMRSFPHHHLISNRVPMFPCFHFTIHMFISTNYYKPAPEKHTLIGCTDKRLFKLCTHNYISILYQLYNSYMYLYILLFPTVYLIIWSLWILYIAWFVQYVNDTKKVAKN